MKRLAMFVMLIGSVVLSACGGASGDTPSSVVKAWNEAATVSFDAAKAKSLSCAAFQPAIDQAIQAMQTAGVKTDVSGLQYSESNVTADHATVRVYGKITITMAGQATTQDFDRPVDVIKEGGKWVACPQPSAAPTP